MDGCRSIDLLSQKLADPILEAAPPKPRQPLYLARLRVPGNCTLIKALASKWAEDYGLGVLDSLSKQLIDEFSNKYAPKTG